MRHNRNLKNGISQDINVAKRCYFFRLTCGHLYEALSVFKIIKEERDIKQLINNKSIGGKAYRKLLKIPNDFYKQLCQIRHNAVFHYGTRNEKIIKEAIEGFKNSEESSIMVSKLNRKTRYIIADDIINAMLGYLRPPVNIGKIIRQIEDAQIRLADFINFLSIAYIQDRIRSEPALSE
jgi:hypothetical protein